jgi:hypothetical protein
MGPYKPKNNPNIRCIKPLYSTKSRDWRGEMTSYHYDKETTPEGKVVRRYSIVVIRPARKGCTLHDSNVHPLEPFKVLSRSGDPSRTHSLPNDISISDPNPQLDSFPEHLRRGASRERKICEKQDCRSRNI